MVKIGKQLRNFYVLLRFYEENNFAILHLKDTLTAEFTQQFQENGALNAWDSERSVNSPYSSDIYPEGSVNSSYSNDICSEKSLQFRCK